MMYMGSMAECAGDHPRLAAAFYTAGRGELLKQVAAFLKSLTARGFLSIKDPSWRQNNWLHPGLE
jgi:hypothetical protein